MTTCLQTTFCSVGLVAMLKQTGQCFKSSLGLSNVFNSPLSKRVGKKLGSTTKHTIATFVNHTDVRRLILLT